MNGPSKDALTIIGRVMMLAGGVFFLQGVNILPGSFMTGDLHWAVYGGISMLIGALCVWFARRR